MLSMIYRPELLFIIIHFLSPVHWRLIEMPACSLIYLVKYLFQGFRSDDWCLWELQVYALWKACWLDLEPPILALYITLAEWPSETQDTQDVFNTCLFHPYCCQHCIHKQLNLRHVSQCWLSHLTNLNKVIFCFLKATLFASEATRHFKILEHLLICIEIQQMFYTNWGSFIKYEQSM